MEELCDISDSHAIGIRFAYNLKLSIIVYIMMILMHIYFAFSSDSQVQEG